MKTSNLLIVGGVVLVGGYLFLKKKKPKKDTQESAIAYSQAVLNAPVEDSSVIKTIDKQALLTSQEATVFATKTIAEVNSLMVKYPPLTMQQFVDNYNSSYKTDLIIDAEGKIVSPTSANTSPPIQGSGLTSIAGDLIRNLENQAYMIKEINGRASDANRQFKGQQMIYTRWKSDFATVYGDLKNYYSTLTKEQADFIIKYLPKMIIQAFMGDNDPRARANDFYSQEEIIDMVDNSIVKDTERLVDSALNNFVRNYKMSIGEYSLEMTAVPITRATASVTPKYN